VHGDTKGAGQIAAAVRHALREAGVETAPLGS
jgi:lactam utilization protein B